MATPYARDQLLGTVYEDVHRAALARMRQSETITMLDTTSLVHEAYLSSLGRVNSGSPPALPRTRGLI